MVCGLEDLPEAVGRVTQLRTLSLYNSLPEAVWRLDQLVTLNLVANRLESVPEGIGWLTRLQMLDLGHDQLAACPALLFTGFALE
jgi:leucine-rich repeat protein SHOC2